MNKADQARQGILESIIPLVAKLGPHAVSMRDISHESDTAISALYHYFSDKDSLMLELYQFCNRKLGQLRLQTPVSDDKQKAIHDRIAFQFDHAELVVAVLKYYMDYRDSFAKQPIGFLPDKTYLHIEEITKLWSDDWVVSNPRAMAVVKLITHGINGYVLEFYPNLPKDKERAQIITSLTSTIMTLLDSRKEVKS